MWTAVIPFIALDDLILCYRHNFGCPLIVLGRVAWFAVRLLTGPLITFRMVVVSDPLTIHSICFSCVASRGDAVPVLPGGSIIIPSVVRHVWIRSKYILDNKLSANSLSANRNGMHKYHHIHQRLSRDMRTRDGHCIYALRERTFLLKKVQIRRRTVCQMEIGNCQLTAERVVSFTTFSSILRRTCVNCSHVVGVLSLFLSSPLRSSLLSLRRPSGPVTVLVRTSHLQSPCSDDNQEQTVSLW